MRKYIFLFIVFVTFISSCTEDIDKTFDVEINKSLYDLSGEEALAIAKTFHKSVTSTPETRTSIISLDIKSKYRLDTSGKTRAISNEKAPLIYEIEMNDGIKNGKVIVSGDKRFPEVLAYIPSFNDSIYKISPEPNVMVQMAKNALLNKIQNYKTTLLTRSYAVDSVPGEVSVMIIPFCRTAWHQSSPYNQLLPRAWVEYAAGVGSRPGSSWYDNYYTGQAAVAIAQAMAYLQPYLNINGTDIDWDVLITKEDVAGTYKNMAATLFKYIYDTIGTYPVWGKSYNDTWPKPAIVDAVIAMETPIKNALQVLNSSQCGLVCDNDQNWNLDIVKKSLISLNPVFVGDPNRLAFLVDGYAINEVNSTYLHCNFGRSGNFNGYYMVYDDGRVVFEFGDFMYRDFALRIIPNIRNR